MSGVGKPGTEYRVRGRGGPRNGQGRPMATPAPGDSGMANVASGQQRSSRTASESSSASSELCSVYSKMTVSSDETFIKEAILAPKKPPNDTSDLKTFKLDTNMSVMKIPKDLPIYRYDMDITALKVATSNSKGYEIPLSKGIKDDVISTDRKDNCLRIFHRLCELEPSIFGNPQKYIYDRAANLFSPDKLNIGKLKTFTITKENVPVDVTVECKGVIIKVQPSVETFELTLGDLRSSTNPNLDLQDRSLRSFLELLTSQDAVNREEHVIFGGNVFHLNGSSFGLDDKVIGEGKFVASGVNKGVRIIEGDGTGPIPAIATDAKKAAFYTSQRATVTLAALLECHETDLQRVQQQNFPWSYVRNYFKDITVQKTYAKKNTFTVTDLSKQTASQIMVNVDDDRERGGESKTVSLINHFQEKYGIRVKYPNLPCLVERIGGRRINYYPMELCIICDNQRVPMEKQSPEQMSAMIKYSAVKPYVRKQEIYKNLVALNLHNGGRENPVLNALGIAIADKPIQVTAKQLPAPTPVYANNFEACVNPEKANWQSSNAKYLNAAIVRKWIVLVCQESASYVPRNVDVFISKLMDQFKKKGMTIARPVDVKCVKPSKEAIDEEMRNAKSRGIEFVLYIEDLQNTLHNHLKLMETMHQLPTQQVNMRIVNDVVKGKWQTTENIVHKTNEKNGGLNYRVIPDKFQKCEWLLNGELMVVGYDVSHPPPLSKDARRRGLMPRQPSTIGMSFNGSKNPEQFIGDFHYQQPRAEEVTARILTSRFVWMLQTFKNSRGRLPKRLIVYRDGISEGQYKMFMTEEVAAIRAAFAKVGEPNYNPPLTAVIATKRHNRRFFAGEENAPPGVVIDNVITRVDCSEFYLLSHRAIQGTAKATDYTIPVDDADMSMAHVQAITHALCYHHQIVNSAISLPEPVYQADEWAKRGKNNFNAHIDYFGHGIENETAEMDFEGLTAQLSYKNKLISANRLV
uniref:Uncharacterized protein n=1 Tax=Plectus sambesii TaxID=2011161 RepID=A0A914XAR5_9BILA